MNIVLLDADTLGNSNLDGIRALGKLITYNYTKRNEIIQRANEANIIITNKVVLDREILSQLKNLKLICITATGTNNIDLEYAKEANICVKNVANYSTNSVAQHTIMLALNILGQLNYYDRYVKKGKWARGNVFCHFNLNNEMYTLNGKNWGIIGLGNIGKKVASILRAFDVNISYYSTSGANDNSEFKRVHDLKELLRSNDIISIHAPLNDKTRNLISHDELSLLKEDSILINVGRGGIVNENSLSKIIEKNKFYFACDVLENEPMIENHPFLNKKIKDRIIITPHISWGYKESREILMKEVVKNIKDFICDNSF